MTFFLNNNFFLMMDKQAKCSRHQDPGLTAQRRLLLWMPNADLHPSLWAAAPDTDVLMLFQHQTGEGKTDWSLWEQDQLHPSL